VAHEVRHELASAQTNPPGHGPDDPPDTQLPLPSQAELAVNVKSEQDPEPHGVPTGSSTMMHPCGSPGWAGSTHGNFRQAVSAGHVDWLPPATQAPWKQVLAKVNVLMLQLAAWHCLPVLSSLRHWNPAPQLSSVQMLPSSHCEAEPPQHATPVPLSSQQKPLAQ